LEGYTAALVGTEATSIADGKAVFSFDEDLIGLAVNFFHSFDFPKDDSIAIVESMLLFIVQVDEAGFFLRDG
jgi:hypothetical protein